MARSAVSARARSYLRRRLVAVVREAVRAELLGDDVVTSLTSSLRAPVREAVRAELLGDDVVTTLTSSLRAAVAAEVVGRLRHDIGLAMDAASVASSARLVLDRMQLAAAQVTPADTMRFALEASPPEGLMLEFGVASGRSLRMIAEARQGRLVFGFDSFQGLPQDWRIGFGSGEFVQERLPDVPGAELVVGLFEDSLPRFVKEHDGVVAFLHCDADLYESTCSILRHAGDRLRRGSVVLFDEYFNFPWWEEHEHKAWTEWTAEHSVDFEYIAFTWEHQQVAVRVLSTPWDG